MRRQALLGVKDPHHRVAGIWEISSELAKHTSKSSQSPTCPQLAGKAPRRALGASHCTYPLAAWCPRSLRLPLQPQGPGGGGGRLGHCWVSARHLGSQRNQRPAGLGAQVGLGWAAGGLAPLEGWPSEVSGLRSL